MYPAAAGWMGQGARQQIPHSMSAPGQSLLLPSSALCPSQPPQPCYLRTNKNIPESKAAWGLSLLGLLSDMFPERQLHTQNRWNSPAVGRHLLGAARHPATSSLTRSQSPAPLAAGRWGCSDLAGCVAATMSGSTASPCLMVSIGSATLSETTHNDISFTTG